MRQQCLCHSPGLPGSSPLSTHSSCGSTPKMSYDGSDNTSLGLEDKPSYSNTHKEDNRCVLIHKYCKYTKQKYFGFNNQYLFYICYICCAVFVTVEQSLWANQEHREVRTWKQPCAVCQPVNRITHLNARSLMWSVSGNSTPWHQTLIRLSVPVVS